MNKTKKSGCILINIEEKTVALVYRDEQKDYSFPKGHIEKDETIVECAIRETNEETKRECSLLEKDPIFIENYTTPAGEKCEVYFYLAKDIGPSNNTSLETHKTFWIPVEKVYNKLSYQDLKKLWSTVLPTVKKYL